MQGHVIIAGFDSPDAQWRRCSITSDRVCVIELNPDTVGRCNRSGVHIVQGDVKGS